MEIKRKMTVAKKIRRKIKQMKTGITFNYQQLGIARDEYIAAAKVIERLISNGEINRATTGVFYKPKQSIFGELPPTESELIKPYLFLKGKRIAYITGTALFNNLGLTTQVPKSLKIASSSKRISINKGNIQAKPVKSYVAVTNKNYALLELLDVMKEFNKIPDMDDELGLSYLLKKIAALKEKNKRSLVRYALAYPPRCRAFLGALLETIDADRNTASLKRSLNPLSTYDIGINTALLPTAQNWNFKLTTNESTRK